MPGERADLGAMPVLWLLSLSIKLSLASTYVATWPRGEQIFFSEASSTAPNGFRMSSGGAITPPPPLICHKPPLRHKCPSRNLPFDYFVHRVVWEVIITQDFDELLYCHFFLLHRQVLQRTSAFSLFLLGFEHLKCKRFLFANPPERRKIVRCYPHSVSLSATYTFSSPISRSLKVTRLRRGETTHDCLLATKILAVRTITADISPDLKKEEEIQANSKSRQKVTCGGHVMTFDFCLIITTRFDNKHIRSCLASRRSVAGRGPWHKTNLPAAHWLSLPFYTLEGAWPLSQPSGGEFAVDLRNRLLPGRGDPCYFRNQEGIEKFSLKKKRDASSTASRRSTTGISPASGGTTPKKISLLILAFALVSLSITTWAPRGLLLGPPPPHTHTERPRCLASAATALLFLLPQAKSS